MTDNLPPLPPCAPEFKPRWPNDPGGHTADQMKAYALAAIAAQHVPASQDAANLLARYERQWHRMGELWERCQGKGWPDKEGAEFAQLRDERAPATRAALLAFLAAAPQPQPVQQCKWPTCQSEKYQQDLEDQIMRELVGEQPVQEPVAEVQVKMTGANAGIATMIYEVYDPRREPLKPGDMLYTSPQAQPQPVQPPQTINDYLIVQSTGPLPADFLQFWQTINPKAMTRRVLALTAWNISKHESKKQFKTMTLSKTFDDSNAENLTILDLSDKVFLRDLSTQAKEMAESPGCAPAWAATYMALEASASMLADLIENTEVRDA